MRALGNVSILLLLGSLLVGCSAEPETAGQGEPIVPAKASANGEPSASAEGAAGSAPMAASDAELTPNPKGSFEQPGSALRRQGR